MKDVKIYVEKMRDKVIEKGLWKKTTATDCCFSSDMERKNGHIMCLDCGDEALETAHYELLNDDFWFEEKVGNKDVMVTLYHVEYKRGKIILKIKQTISETEKVEFGVNYKNETYEREYPVDPKDVRVL